jgi:hypothetical protein
VPVCHLVEAAGWSAGDDITNDLVEVDRDAVTDVLRVRGAGPFIFGEESSPVWAETHAARGDSLEPGPQNAHKVRVS